MVVVAVLALVVALVALGIAVRTARAARHPALTTDGLPADLPVDVPGLRAEVAALQAETATALRHLAVVRYDAFPDQGGHLSWSLALLDDAGDGAVMSSIHGRSDARTYAKSVAHWSCEQQLSPEEADAIAAARP